MLRHGNNSSIKPCTCGFGDKQNAIESSGRKPTYNYCPNINKLDNHVDCPSFDAVCHEDVPCEPYWRLIKGSFKQIRRWCLMGEIVEVDYFIRPKLTIRTRFNENVKVAFHLEEDTHPRTFSFEDALIGHTMLIMYAEKHDFLDMTTGVRQEDGDLVVIFKCSMQTLIKTFGSMMNSPVCFQCERKQLKPTDNSTLDKKENQVSVHLPSPDDQGAQLASSLLPLKKCSRCQVALYCNEICQTQHWKASHKSLCSSMKYLQLLRELDFTTSSVISKKNSSSFSFAS